MATVRKICALACLCVPLLVAGSAAAESKKTVKYPYDWVFKSAIRLLKVDLKCKIEEEDREGGYILFWYEHNKVKSYASMELADSSGDDEGWRVVVRVVMDKLPGWVEEDVINQLVKKIKDTYGTPPAYKKKDAKGKDEDKGKDEGKEKDKEKEGDKGKEPEKGEGSEEGE